MSLDLPGFADPVSQSQSCFRALLDAMARPGHVATVDDLRAPPTLGAATAAVLLTLVDGDTPLFLDAAFAGAWDWVRFHCGTAPAPLGEARFVCAAELPDLRAIHAGTDLAPEDSATAIVQVAALGEGTPYRLTGPGIEREQPLRVDGLPPDFVARWAANGALYPCGADLVLCAGDRLCALPRTVRITEG